MNKVVVGLIAAGAGLAVVAGALQLTLGQGSLSFLKTQSRAPRQASPVSEETVARGRVAGEATRTRVFVRFKEMPGNSERVLVENHGGEVRFSYSIVPAIAAELPEPAINALKKDPRVVAVEPDMEVTVLHHEAELDHTWGVKHIGAGAVHHDGNQGASVKVAVLDTGIDYTHSELQAVYKGGYDFVDRHDDPIDRHGHGTHVAGTIAAALNNTGVVGVSPEVELYSLKVLSDSGSGSYSYIVAALQWAIDNGMQVTNHSYGSGLNNPGSTVQAAFDKAYEAGILAVSSAGNSGTSSGGDDVVGYPARYDSVIAVASVDSSNRRASFSSTGPAVELAAPGVQVRSTLVGGGYGNKNGTSMASPHVAGTAALVMSAGVTDVEVVRTILASTAIDLGDPGRDAWYGYGLVDAAAAVSADPGPINNAPTVAIISPPNGAIFDPGEAAVFEGSANDMEDGDLGDNLVWASSLDGQIGTGRSVSTSTLREGSHTITASVTDSGGKSGSDAISITISVSEQDTIPPTAPENLTGWVQGKHVRLSWSASTDNIAVTGYNVIRDGSHIGTSANTDYQDKSVSSGAQYVYEVEAFDAAGNVSPRSNAVIVSLVRDGDDDGGGGGRKERCSPWPACNK